jgi:hypothetical protein
MNRIHDLMVSIRSKLFDVNNSNSPPSRNERQYRGRARGWQRFKERPLFYYRIVMHALLCAIAGWGFFFGPSVWIRAVAGAALWSVLRAFTKQLAK